MAKDRPARAAAWGVLSPRSASDRDNSRLGEEAGLELVPRPAARPVAGRSSHPLTGCSLKALIPLNISSLMMKE